MRVRVRGSARVVRAREQDSKSCEIKRARVVRVVSARVVRAREQELHSTVQKIQ